MVHRSLPIGKNEDNTEHYIAAGRVPYIFWDSDLPLGSDRRCGHGIPLNFSYYIYTLVRF